LKPGETCTVQFLSKPEDFTEFETHSWSDGSRWNFVPCAGDECPLCQDEDSDKRKKSYRFACLVYSFRDKAVKVLEGPKDLAGRIFFRYERKPTMFTKRTYEITKLATTPVSYDFAVGEDDLVSAATLKKASEKVSVDEYLELELKAFYGNELPEASGKGLAEEPDEDEDEDEDEDDETEEVSYSLGDLRKMKIAKLTEIAEELDIDVDDMDKTDIIEAIVEAGSDEDEDDEDEDDEPDEDEDEDDESEDDEDDEDEEDEDEDDEDEEDDEEDDDEPAPAKKSAAKKVAAKKAPAKKAAARRR